MHRTIRVLLLLALPALLGTAPRISVASTTSTYHIDAVGGDDTTGDGSLASPWRTLSKLGGETLLPGDCVRLKRDSVFRERLLIDESGTSSAPIVVEAYGTGEDPVISAGALIPEGSAWSGPDANGEYTLDVGTTLEFYTADAVLVRSASTGVDTYILLGRGTNGSLAADTYEARAASGRRILHVKPPSGTSPADFDYELAKRNYAVRVTGDYVHVRDVQALLGNDGHPVQDAPVVIGTIGASGDHCSFQHCRVAFARTFGLYVAGTDSVIDGCVAEHNHSTGIVIQGSGAVRNTVSGSIARYNGNLETKDLDRGGIGIQGDDAVITGNSVHDNGNPDDTTAPRVGGDGAVQLFDCANSLIENNFIANSVRTAIDMSYTADTFGHEIVGNVVFNWNLVGGAGTLKTQAIFVVAYGDTSNSGNATVVHNTVYSDQDGVDLVGIQVSLPTNSDTMKNTVVKNNIVSMPNNTSAGAIGLRLQRGHRYYATEIDFNCVYVPLNAESTYVWLDAGGLFEFETAADLAANIVYCDSDPRCVEEPGFESNGLNVDPLFVAEDPQLPAEFDLDADSELIDAGDDEGRTLDFLGRAVPAGDAPDIGAIEFQGTPLEELEELVAEAIDLLEDASPKGVEGMVKKLDGNGGLLRKVSDAVSDYESGAIDAEEYVAALETALSKLGAFENQLEGKAKNGQIVDPELTGLRAFVDDATALIEEMIDEA
jgi:hypothetical protein